jgi:hypothetical protein
MYNSDISIIITGPIDDRTFESIDSYYDQGFEEVIVSTWKDEDLSLLNKTKKEYKLILSEYPENLNEINNQGCRFFQAFTTWKGSRLVTKKYCIRARSDELYPDLSAFVENMRDNPQKVHTTDNGFWKMHNFCFSSHLFGGKTEVIKEGCFMMVLNAEKTFLDNIQLDYPEQCFGFYFLLANGCDIRVNPWKQAFYENVFITPCKDLPGHLHSGQSFTGYRFKRNTDYPNNRPDRHQRERLYQSCEEFLC